MAKLSEVLSDKWVQACKAHDHDNGLEHMLDLDMEEEKGSESYPTQIVRLTKEIDLVYDQMEESNRQAIVNQFVDQFAVWHYG